MKAKWKVNSTQSDVLIKRRRSIIGYLGGSADTFQGHVEFKNNEIEDATVEFSLEMKNKETILEKTQNYLKLDDFFEINKSPAIKFKSTTFQKANKNIHFLKGDLTIKEITRTVEFDVQLIETDLYDKDKKVLLELSGEINRRDFNLPSNTYIQNNSLSTRQDIKLIANLEFTI